MPITNLYQNAANAGIYNALVDYKLKLCYF